MRLCRRRAIGPNQGSERLPAARVVAWRPAIESSRWPLRWATLPASLPTCASGKAFGALLYELMVTLRSAGRPQAEPRGAAEHSSPRSERDADVGVRPPQDLSQVVVPGVLRVGPKGVRAAATRLALRCPRVAGNPPVDMQRVLMEVRLYGLMARQSGWQSTTGGELAAGNPSVPPPPRANPLSSMALAEGQKLAASFPPKTEARPLRVEHRLGPEWMVVPVDQTGSPPFIDVECPRCAASFVHRSRPRTRFECLLLAAGLSLNRCHRCLYRYVAILGIVFPKGAEFDKPPYY
jgi:hypothetical protein